MIGRQIQNYRIDRLLGQGGMGSVYLATDVLLDRPVAVKMLLPSLVSQPTFLERFKTEAQVLARLNHPNIATLYTYIREGTDYFMIMEYLEGKTLDGWLQQYGPLPPTMAIQLLMQALAGLEHAHTKGILHRDLKPANLMITPDGVVKIMDFGIARVVGSQRLTQVNRTIGTLEYMAPEQLLGQEPQSQSDLYALGVVLFESLTGKVPHTGTSDYEIMERVLKQDCVPLRKCVANLPTGLDEAATRALRKKPEQRFATAQAFQMALQKVTPYVMRLDDQAIAAYQRPRPVPTQVVPTPAPEKARTRLSNVPPPTIMSAPRPASGPRATNNADGWLTRNRRQVGVAAILLLMLLGWLLWPSSPATQNLVDTGADSTRTVAAMTARQPDLVATDPAFSGAETSPITIDQPGPGETIGLPDLDQPVTLDPTPTTPTPTEKPKPTPPEDKPERVSKDTPRRPSRSPETTQPDDPPATTVSSPVVITPPPVEADPTPNEPIASPPATEKPAPSAPVKATPTSRRSRLPGGTEITLQLNEVVAASAAREGHSVTFSVARPVVVGGEVLIPQGATARGNITGVSTGDKKEMLEIRVRDVETADGQHIAVKRATFKYIGGRNESVRFSKGQQFMVYTANSISL